MLLNHIASALYRSVLKKSSRNSILKNAGCNVGIHVLGNISSNFTNPDVQDVVVNYGFIVKINYKIKIILFIL